MINISFDKGENEIEGQDIESERESEREKKKKITRPVVGKRTSRNPQTSNILLSNKLGEVIISKYVIRDT